MALILVAKELNIYLRSAEFILLTGHALFKTKGLVTLEEAILDHL